MAKKHRMPGAERVDIYRGVAGDLLLNSKSEKPLGISDLGTLVFSPLAKLALYRDHGVSALVGPPSSARNREVASRYEVR